MIDHPRWLLVSDVDDTLLGNNNALLELKKALQTAPHVTVAYNSSRPCASLRRSLAQNPHLPTPNFLIGALGTEIQDGPSGQPLTDYTEHLGRTWNREAVVTIAEQFEFQPHPDEYQTPFKASFTVPGPAAHATVVAALAHAGLPAKAIFSGGKNLDLIPASAGKGQVIDFLRQHLGIAPTHVVVAGDSGNDLEMFIEPYRGIVVANADPELKQHRPHHHIYQAKLAYAAGVLEGLRFWSVL